MPTRDRPASDGDKQNRPDRPENPLRIEQERAGWHGHRDVREGSRERTHEKQDDRGVRRVEGQIVRRLNEHRRRKHGGRVQDYSADKAPDREIPNAPRQCDGNLDTQIDAEDDEPESDSRDREHVHLHSIEELSTQ